MNFLNKYKSKLFVMGLILLNQACSNKQEVATIEDPTNYPSVTISPAENYSNVSEGDTLVYDITVDKFFDQDIDFTVIVNEASTGNEMDFSVLGGTFLAYTYSTSISVIISDDKYPEIDESYKMEISASEDRSYNFQLSPNSDVEILDFTVANVNDPDVLTLGVYWEDDHDDWDIYILDEGGDQLDGNVGATGSDPEIIAGVIDNSFNDGVYNVLADAWDVTNENTTFELSIAKPDGSIAVISTSIDITSEEEPVLDGLYHIATITKSGSSYTLNAVK